MNICIVKINCKHFLRTNEYSTYFSVYQTLIDKDTLILRFLHTLSTAQYHRKIILKMPFAITKNLRIQIIFDSLLAF